MTGVVLAAPRNPLTIVRGIGGWVGCMVVTPSVQGDLLQRSAEDGAPENRTPDRHVLECIQRHCKRILLEHREIGPLSYFDAADLVIKFQGIGSAERDRVQRVRYRDALCVAQHPTRGSPAVDGTPGSKERSDRR